MSARRRKAQIAPVITALQDVHAVVRGIADLRRELSEATSIPGEMRALPFHRLWICHAETQRRLDAITAPGLRRRCAELQRQIDRVLDRVARAAIRAGRIHVPPRGRGAIVVDFAAERARRAQRAQPSA